MEKCLLWLDGSHGPYLNMAIDECLLERIGSLGCVMLRFYEWNIPSASFGY